MLQYTISLQNMTLRLIVQNLHSYGQTKQQVYVLGNSFQQFIIQNPPMLFAKPLLALFLLFLSVISNPESFLRTFEYCSYHGYPVEDHIIPTKDHYNLQFYRMQAKNTKIVPGKKVVYLQHGLADSSDTWIVNEEHLSPAFQLANLGYDVWLGNSRGNRYSTKTLSPSVLDFWSFSFHDMAMFDLPAAFRYISSKTNKKIHYIGHSQGTLIMFIALTQQIKDIEENLLTFNAFGPVAYLNHQKSALMNDLSKTDITHIFLTSHVKRMLMLEPDAMRGVSKICVVAPFICAQNLKAISQMNNTVNNLKRLPVIMGHFPAGTSTKNLIHFQQFIRTGQFKNYDYGKQNLKVYGQKAPPSYDLSKIKVPVHLHVGQYDKLADVEDNQRLFKELINSSGKTMQKYLFGHATFIWGKSLEHIQNAVKIIEAVKTTEQSNLIIM